MANNPFNISQRKAAIAAGFSYLIKFAIVVYVNFAHNVILKPVNWGLSLLAAFLRLVWVLTWLGTTLNLFSALKFLSGADYLRAFETERLQALARFYLGLSFDHYYVGLMLMHWRPQSVVTCGTSPVISLELWLPSD